MKIVADDKIPFLRGVLEPYAEVVYRPGHGIRPEDVRDADALIVRTRTRCDASLLDGSSIRFIATATIGFDHIDTAYCAAHRITWTNAEGCNSASVRQYMAAALFHLARTHGFALRDRTIGVVGVGNVGSKVAQFCRAIGMRVLLNDPPRERRGDRESFVSLDAIRRESDLITFHVPLNRDGVDRTLHLVDRTFLGSLRPEQILLNTSRGEVVDGNALFDALRAKRLSAAVLDVWEHEPQIDLDLLAAVAVGTPNIAGYSADGKANGTTMSVQACSRFFGLGIDDWAPAEVPRPANPAIACDCAGRSGEAIAAELVRATYDIVADDRRLRASPETFEQQRGAYPLRREFPAYTVALTHAAPAVSEMIAQMGFQVSHTDDKKRERI